MQMTHLGARRLSVPANCNTIGATIYRTRQLRQALPAALSGVHRTRQTACSMRRNCYVNLPGWCWAEILQLALVGSSSSLHSEACNALGASDGVIHSRISLVASSLRAAANKSSQRQAVNDLAGIMQRTQVALDVQTNDTRLRCSYLSRARGSETQVVSVTRWRARHHEHTFSAFWL